MASVVLTVAICFDTVGPSVLLQDPEDEAKFFAAVAKNIKEDNKNETRARRFGDFKGPADDSSSSPALRSSQEDSASSSRPRTSKKKSGKSKKSKKTKAQKKAKASKHRKADSSSEASAAAASSQASEVVSKKRKPSAGATGSKDKKVKKAAPAESESASSQQSPAKTVDKTKELCSVWPLSELQAFEEKAAQQATAAGAAGLEVEQRLALTKELPAAVRKLVWWLIDW